MKRTTKECPKCQRSISISNISKHIQACDGTYFEGPIKPTESNILTKDLVGVTCPKCSRKFNSNTGLKIHFWRVHTEKGKLHNPSKGYADGTRTIWNKGKNAFEDSRIRKYSTTVSNNSKIKLLNKPWEDVGKYSKRTRVILEQDSKCLHCGISEWQGKPITLEVDHIDGNNKNDSRENLRALCPNCHSQTDTWRGKNFANFVDDQQLLAALKKHNWNFRQALLEVGLTPKGGNYKRCHRIKNDNT